MTPLQRQTTQFGHASGFTLTDLLVILACLSVLVCLVAVPLAHVRRTARIQQCTTNLEKVDKAILQFVNEHNKSLPKIVAGPSKKLQ